LGNRTMPLVKAWLKRWYR
ncbi:hypothetical protein VCHENC02_0844B, partial [Vibrio harveyi]